MRRKGKKRKDLRSTKLSYSKEQWCLKKNFRKFANKIKFYDFFLQKSLKRNKNTDIIFLRIFISFRAIFTPDLHREDPPYVGTKYADPHHKRKVK